jgi:hypothetical protein
VTEEILPAEPCQWDGDEWRADYYPGADACPEDALPGSEFCEAHSIYV